MNNEIFRKKSVDRMSSPEQLNDYIRVTNPGVWIVLAAVVFLLIGICVWGIFGKLETKINVVAVSDHGRTVCYAKEETIDSVEEGMSVYIGENTYSVLSVSNTPVMVSDGFGEYAAHIGELKAGEWVYEVLLDGSVPDGVYKAEIVTDSVSPAFFVFN